MHDKKAVAAGVRKWWLKNIIFLVLVGAILFIASGKFNWGMAWAYLIAMVLIVIANAIAMDPALLAERSLLQEGTKKWDVAIASFVGVWGPLCVWVVAGLDNRLGWSKGSGLELQVAALVLFVLGGLLGTWAMASVAIRSIVSLLMSSSIGRSNPNSSPVRAAARLPGEAIAKPEA